MAPRHLPLVRRFKAAECTRDETSVGCPSILQGRDRATPKAAAVKSKSKSKSNAEAVKAARVTRVTRVKAKAVTTMDRDDDDGDSGEIENKIPRSLCRVCNEVPDTKRWTEGTEIGTHPELYWKQVDEDRDEKDAVNDSRLHVEKYHAHWPLWNSIRKWTKPIPDGVEVADFVFYQALEHAAKQLPHDLHQRYENREAFTDMINWRVGAAIDFANGGKMIWTGKWWKDHVKTIDTTQQNIDEVRRVVAVAATALVKSYGKTLSKVVHASWDKIFPLTHQQKVDLYHNVFLVRYCIDAVRDSRNLFPPVHEPKCGFTIEM
jgi:hypothetical protein